METTHKVRTTRPMASVGIGILVLPLATICALSLLPDRLMAVGVSSMLTRQFVLYVEERNRRCEALEADAGQPAQDELHEESSTVVVAALAAKSPALLTASVAHAQLEFAPLLFVHPTETLPPGRAPPC